MCLLNGRRDSGGQIREVGVQGSEIAADMGAEIGAEGIGNRKEMMSLGGAEQTDIGGGGEGREGSKDVAVRRGSSAMS